MTEPDSTSVFDPATDADAPVEETTPSEAPVEETTPSEAPVEETTPSEAPVEEPSPSETPSEEPTPEPASDVIVSPEPVEVSPEPVEVSPDASSDQAELDFNSPEVNAQPVSGVPSPGAVSDVPVQTDNRERPEDGEQDVSQDPTEVPSDDEDPDVVA